MGLYADFYTIAQKYLKDFTGREWLFEQIRTWHGDLDSPRYLLIVGEGGIGKSAIAANLWLKNQLIDAAHFCIAGRGGTLEPADWACGISEQLSSKVAGFSEALIKTQTSYSGQEIQIQQTIQTGPVAPGGLVIGVKIMLMGAPAEHVFHRVLREPLRLLHEEGNLKQITILVDALDEAVIYEGKPNIVDMLTQSKDFPNNVRFVLTTRSESEVLTHFHDLSPVVIAAEGRENRSDIYLYLDRIWEKTPELQQVVSRWGWDKPKFLREMSRKSEWNFLFLSKFLPELESGVIKKPEDVPYGLDEFYFYLLNSRIGLKKWREWGAELLEVILALQEPCTLSQLAQFLGWSKRRTYQRAEQVQQLLDPGFMTGGYCWRGHWAIAQFLFDQQKSKEYWCDMKVGHNHIAQYFLDVFGGISNDLPQLPKLLVKQIKDVEYPLQHLPMHIAQGISLPELDKLFHTHGWLQAHQIYDPTMALYNKGIRLALNLSLSPDSKFLLPFIIGWSLLYASLNTRATQTPSAMLKIMVMTERSEEAQRYTTMIPDKEWQAYAFIVIAEVFKQQGDFEKARFFLDQVLKNNQISKLSIFSNIVTVAAQLKENEIVQDTLSEVLEIAMGTKDPRSFASNMLKIAKSASQVGDIKTTQYALSQVVSKIEAETIRSRTLLSAIIFVIQENNYDECVLYTIQQAWSIFDNLHPNNKHKKYSWHDVTKIAKTISQLDITGMLFSESQSFELDDIGFIFNISRQGVGHLIRALPEVAQIAGQINDYSLLKKTFRQASDNVQDFFHNSSEAAYAYFYLTEIALELDDNNAAQSAYSKFQESFPAVEKMALGGELQAILQSKIAVHTNDIDMLAAASKNALNLETKNPWFTTRALATVAQSYFQLGYPAKAHKTLSLSLDIFDEQGIEFVDEFESSIIDIAIQTGDKTNVKKALLVAQKVQDAPKRAQALNSIAEAFLHFNDLESALSISPQVFQAA